MFAKLFLSSKTINFVAFFWKKKKIEKKKNVGECAIKKIKWLFDNKNVFLSSFLLLI